MFDAEFATFYQDRYDFVKFNDKNEIEYLDGKGELIRKETLNIDKEGNYKIKENPFFRGIEFINSNEINLVIEGEHMENDKSMGIKDMRFKLIKLPHTQIEISQKELEILFANSEWKLTKPNRDTQKTIRFSKWQNVSKEEKEKILNDAKRFSKHKESNHLIKIANSLIFVRQRLDMVKSKAIVSKITENELVVLAENKECILNRVYSK
ncbi:MAG: hypothetical protein AB8H03_28705 [Saprospiraceae bacterium]